jgi:hypothetical protein
MHQGADFVEGEADVFHDFFERAATGNHLASIAAKSRRLFS